MSKATPGPWESSGCRVCAGVGGPDIKVICDTANNKATRTPENAANAALIAAAPELLAACKQMSASLNGSPGDIEGISAAHQALDAAIAKAGAQ